jgi:hypothetical protein
MSEARRLWRGVDPARISDTWRAAIPRLMTVLMGAQFVAGQTATDYVSAALEQQSIRSPVDGLLNPFALVGVASDGRPLDTLLIQPALAAMSALADGYTRSRSMQIGYASLEMLTRTQVADAFRGADSVAGSTRRVARYVRVLTPPSCSRCVVLAGDDRAWNTSFKRHPGCDCISMPTTQTKGFARRTDPRGYFESLSREEQDRVFTKAGAQAIRDGADVAQVVNARRKAAGMSSAAPSKQDKIKARETGVDIGQFAASGGQRRRLQTVDVFGQPTFVTLSGNAIKLPGGGQAPRLMPESIYAIAKDQDHAIRLLKLHGYIY